MKIADVLVLENVWEGGEGRGEKKGKDRVEGEESKEQRQHLPMRIWRTGETVIFPKYSLSFAIWCLVTVPSPVEGVLLRLLLSATFPTPLASLFLSRWPGEV